MSIVLLFALVLSVETPPPVETGAAPAAPAQAAAPAKVVAPVKVEAPAKPAGPVKVAALPSDKICKNDTEAGKRIITRTCRTRAEWEALEIGAREYLRDRRELAPTR